jgi:nucleoside-diphosphate-sugar epimerase
MRALLTGATGFIGSYLVPELIGAGRVVGLTRSDAGADMLARAGADIIRGDVNDLDRLRRAADAADAVIHAAFNHDFSALPIAEIAARPAASNVPATSPPVSRNGLVSGREMLDGHDPNGVSSRPAAW